MYESDGLRDDKATSGGREFKARPLRLIIRQRKRPFPDPIGIGIHRIRVWPTIRMRDELEIAGTWIDTLKEEPGKSP